FPCMFCEGKKAVVVELNKKDREGRARCVECRRFFASTSRFGNREHCDIYADWVDACHAGKAECDE
ncbi:hypothetical protein K470DRAFT_197040, partial [Piedraia hortae CBS 480.64]